MFKLFRKSPWSARIGMFIVILNIVAAIGAPWIAPYSETEIVGRSWSESSSSNFIGTDQLGRDLFSRMIYGARNTIFIAISIALLSFSAGTLLGFLSATFRGWFDLLLCRIVDILMAFPTLIFALMVLSVVGTSIPVLIVVIAILDSTRVFRISRALAMDIEVMDYIEVARLRGERVWWIIRQEILPNAVPPLVAEFGLRFCFIFLFISALSFLGLGLQPPTADWGSMVRDNGGAISYGIAAPLWPAGAIAFLTVGINLIVDWFLYRTSQIRAQ
jgi:peptide/nickel transport system permease protein